MVGQHPIHAEPQPVLPANPVVHAKHRDTTYLRGRPSLFPVASVPPAAPTQPVVPTPVLREAPAKRQIVLRTVDVFDSDQLSDIVPGGHFEHRLIQPAPFQARAVHLETAKFRLDCLRYSAHVALKGEFRNGCVAIAFSLRLPGEMVICGVPHPSFALMHFDPTTEIELRLPADGEWAVLTIDSDVFEAEMKQRRPVRTAECVPLIVADPHRRRLAALLRSTIDAASGALAAAPAPWVAAEQDDMLLNAFFDAYVCARAAQSNDHGALARRRRLVARAEEFIYAHIDDSVRMKRLCRDVGASARTLEYAFKGVYGIGVMEALRTLRLNEVRKKLLRSFAHEVTVTTAAMDWGFWHLGEFAAAYKRLFGELPSQTLRLNRTRPTAV